MRTTETGVNGLVDKINKVFRTAARAVVPVWKTTNLSVIYRESGFPRATLALAQARLRIRTRFACLDRNYPISRRADRKIAGALMTRLQRTALIAGCVTRPSLFAHNNSAVLPGPDFHRSIKEEAAEKHLELLDSLPTSTLVVYLDRLQDKIGNTGWGAAAFYKARAIKANRSLLNAEVYNAEAVGAFEGLKLRRERICADPSIKELILFLDNLSVVDSILGPTPAFL